MTEVADGVVGEVGEVISDLVDGHLDGGNLLLGLLDVELGDFADGLLGELEHVVAGDVAFEVFLVGTESLEHVVHLLVPREAVALFHFLVDAFLKEYLLQRNPVPAVLELGELYFQFLTQEVLGAEGVVAQDVAGGHEDGLVVDDDAGLGGEGYLAGGEGI